MRDRTWVQLWLGLLTFVLCGCGVGPHPPAPVPEEPALLALEPTSLDLGDISPGASFEFAVRITNTGPLLIKLREPSASCGCATVSLERADLEAGQSVLLKGKVRAPTKPEPINQTV